MYDKRFQVLIDKIVPNLREVLPDNDVQVLQQANPFSGMLIGISKLKGSSSYEVYEVNNDGVTTYWQDKGNTQIQ